MESPFLRTAAYNVVYNRSRQHRFFHYVHENTTLFGRTREANGRPFHCPSLLSRRVCPWVCKLSFSNMFFSDLWLPNVLINTISTYVSMSRCHSSPQNDYVVAKQTFNIFILRFFRANSIVFISSSVGFSNEDNCCQSQGIKKLIKKKLLKYFQS